MADNENLRARATEVLSKCTDAVLTSVSEEGYPRSCYLAVIGCDTFKTIYFSTGMNGTKVRHFKKNPKASVAYQFGGNGVTLMGNVELCDDIAKKRELWSDWLKDYFHGGAEDENYALLKFTANEATYWIDGVFLTEKL